MLECCQKCGLYKQCNSPMIKGRGNSDNPKIILIGEAPGLTEDREGKVFIGKSGQLLERTLKERMKEVYIINAVKCCPHPSPLDQDQIRTPTQHEIECCRELLYREIAMFSEDVLLMPMGNPALTALIGEHEPITKELKKTHFFLNKLNNKTYRVAPQFHPAYILRNGSKLYTFNYTFDKAFNSIEGKTNIATPQILKPVDAIQELRKIRELYQQKELKHWVLDLETNSLNPFKGGIIIYAFGYGDKAFAAPTVVTNEVHHKDLPFECPQLDWGVSDQERAKLGMEIKKTLDVVPVIGHNIKFDLKFCVVAGTCDLSKVQVYDDTLSLAMLTYGRSLVNKLSLKNLCVQIFGIEDWSQPVSVYLKKFRLLKDRHYGKIPTGVLGKYAALDISYTSALFKHLKEELGEEADQTRLMLNNAVLTFTEAEVKGVHVDMSFYEYLKIGYTEMLTTANKAIRDLPTVKKLIDERMIDLVANNEKKRKPKPIEELREGAFKTGSSNTIKELLYDDWKLPVIVKTKKGSPSTARDTLDMLLKEKNIPEEAKIFIESLKQYKTFSKLKSTYIDSLPDLVVDGTYKPDYNLTGTVSGRLSSGFHTVPSKSDLKRMFDSRWKEDGGLILSPDYSQLELRVAASLSNEQTWIDAYNKDIDLHTASGSGIYNVPLDQVTKEQRNHGKTINFGILYGMSPHALAENLDITFQDADAMIAKFFRSTKNLKLFIDEQHEFVEKHGYVETPFGRRIFITEGLSLEPKLVAEAHRRAVNGVVQSTASDLVTDSTIKLHQVMKKRKIKSIIMGSVHDCILADTYPGELFEMCQLFQETCVTYPMENYSWIKCPIRLDVSLGSSWGGCIDLETIESTDDKIVLKGNSLKKDFRLLKVIGSTAYNIDINIIETGKMKEFPIDQFIRDVKVTGIITITRK